jgi:hypothetical protein
MVSTLFAISLLVSAAPAAHPDLKPLVAEVSALVTRHYPKAIVTRDNQTIRFEFSTRKFMLHEPLKTGEWQDAHEEVGPQKGGVWGWMELRDGKYNGQAILPQAFDKRYFVLNVIAPYSKKLDRHLYVHLKHPRDADRAFLRDFDTLVNTFDKLVSVRLNLGRSNSQAVIP